jgi:hypothetical protein
MRRAAGRQHREPTLATQGGKKVGCTGKRCYDSFKTAERMARSTNRQKDTNTEPYHCKHCNSFHVGTQSGLSRRRPKQSHQLEEMDE